MKRFIYMFILLPILLGCTKDHSENETNESGLVTVQFKVDIPEEQPIDTRVNENLITNLNLLIFDENGRFISRHQASFSGNNYTVILPQSNNKRIIHFIANYTWGSFSDASFVMKDEGEIIAPLQSTDLIFWQRVVLNSGINASVFNTQSVSLIRNMAKFSLENKPLSGLTNVKFALFNKASIGSVAPFNTTTHNFESIITEPVGVAFTDASVLDVTDIYTFERRNSIVTTTPTYVIIQGTYAGATSYYKVDIVDANKNMYDIKRTTWFKIVVESVTMAGYSTIDAAKSSPASNNISASVLLQSYPTISDGFFVLSVNKTVASFTTNGQILNANATYKTVAGVSINSLVTVTLIQDPVTPVINGNISYDVLTGNLTADINNVPANGVSRVATIKIEAGVLSRTIRLMLHSPFTFANISMTPSVVGNVLESPATLKFTVPVEAEYLLPFNCYITSAYITPVFGNVEVIYENGTYKYKWKVTNVGEQIVNLKTNTNNAAETIFIGADLFQKGQIAYTNANGVYRFSNVVITPYRVDFGVAKAVTLKFSVPIVGNYRIYTNNLNPVGGVVVGGYYTYTAALAGEQIVSFTTNKQNIEEIIKLTGSNFLDYNIALKNQLVGISGTLTYRNTGLVINNGTITVSVGTKVVGMFNTSPTGTYQVSIEANMNDLLSFKYTTGGITYTATQTITSTPMVITKRLL